MINLKKWKEDFPISREDASNVGRRDFARMLVALAGGLTLANGIIVLRYFFKKKPEKFEKEYLCKKIDVPVGGTKSFVLKNSKIPYILIRTENDEFYAYEQKCTHLSCAVYYKPKTNTIICPCHNGFFDVKTGRVLQGPPPRPLKKIEVILNNDEIFVKEI